MKSKFKAINKYGFLITILILCIVGGSAFDWFQAIYTLLGTYLAYMCWTFNIRVDMIENN